jgi:geranylgeranyl reductase family protein
MFDCIIVGAGPAGASAAYHLAKQGRSILLLEKSSFPRHKPCGGGVSPAIAQWFDFDLTPAIDNTVTKVQYTWKMGDPMQTELNMAQPMWMVRRDIFDRFLVEQAQKQGAELKDNTEVTGIQFQQDSWSISTNQGNFEASYLIAADGAKGPMANWLGFKNRQQFLGGTLEVETEVAPEQQNLAYFDFGSLKNGYIWRFPKHNGYAISGAILRSGKAKSEELKKQLANYATESGISLTNSSYYEYNLNLWTEDRPLHAQKALLAGEAAAIVDPLTGEGIRPAIFTGLKAAEAIAGAIAGDEEALAKYSQIVSEEWGNNLALANRLAGLFHQFPKIAYKVGLKKPAAAQLMGKVLCGDLRYADIAEQAMKKIKGSLIPGMGN